MEWLWTVIGMAIATIATYLIAKYNLSGKIGDITGRVDEIGRAVIGLYGTIMEAMKPEPDGTVVLTPEEVTKIKDSLKALLALFGIKLPLSK